MYGDVVAQHVRIHGVASASIHCLKTWYRTFCNNFINCWNFHCWKRQWIICDSVVKSRWLCYFQESRRTCQKFYYIPRHMQCRRGLAMRIRSVSVCQNYDKTEERSVQIFIPYERAFSLVFWEEWLVGDDLFYLKFWVNWPPLERNRRFWTDIRS